MSQGANAQFAWGFEEAAGVSQPGQKAGTMYGVRFKNFAGLPNPTSLRTTNIDPRGQQLKARNGHYEIPFSTDADLDVDTISRLRFHMQGMATITVAAAGVQSWAIRDRITADAPTVDPARFSIEVDKDDSYATLYLNCCLTDWNLSVKEGVLITHKLSGLACRFTNMADPAYLVGPGVGAYTGTVYVRGNRQDADAIDTTTDLKFKVSTAGALDGTAKVYFTKGVVAYGTIQYPVVAGVWMDVILADGTHASGDQLNPVQIMFTLGTGVLTLGGTPDEWKIVGKRTKITPTYSARNNLIGVKAIVTIGGVAYDVESFDIDFKRPRKYRRATSSPFPIDILPDGRRSFAVKIMRDYVDRALYLKMLSATSMALDITINGDFIATVATVSYYEKHQFISSNVQIDQAGANIPSDKQLPESISLVPFWDGTTVELSEVIQGTLATLK